MKSFGIKGSLLKKREVSLKRNLKKRKKSRSNIKVKNASSVR